MQAEHSGCGQKWRSFAHFCATGISNIGARCWLATSVCCRIFVAPGAKANALSPHEPSVTPSVSVFRVLPRIDGDCYVRNVGHCVPQSLSLRCATEVHRDINCRSVQLFSCPLLLVSFCDTLRRSNPDEQRTLVQTNRPKRSKLLLI